MRLRGTNVEVAIDQGRPGTIVVSMVTRWNTKQFTPVWRRDKRRLD
jgi:hypothetical protein